MSETDSLDLAIAKRLLDPRSGPAMSWWNVGSRGGALTALNEAPTWAVGT